MVLSFVGVINGSTYFRLKFPDVTFNLGTRATLSGLPSESCDSARDWEYP